MDIKEENIYSDILDQENNDQATGLKESMFVASKKQPDAAAQEFKLSESTGVPADVVARNKEQVQEKSAIDSIDYGSLIDKNPAVATWLQDPANASVSHDDVDNLKAHEKEVKGYNVFNSFWKSLNSGMAGSNAMLARIPAATFDVAMYPGNVYLKATGQGDKQVRSPEWLRNNPVAKYYDAQQEAWKVPEMDKSIIEQAGKGDFAGAGKSLFSQLITNAPQQAVIIASALTGRPMVGLGYAGATQTAAANKTAQESGVDPASATTDAMAQGSLEVLLERAGTLGVLKKWENAIANSVGKQTSKQVMKELGKTILYTGLAEGNEEFLTQAGQDFSDYVTGVNPDGLKGILQRSIDAGLIGAASGVAMTAPSAIGSGMQRGRQIKQAEQDKNFYLSLGATAESSKLRERLPEAHRKYVDSLVKDSPVENIYIPVEAWDVFMQSKGVDPSAIAGQVGISKEYDQAKEIGKDIRVPLATWANKVVGTEYYQGLSDDIKFDPAGQTVNEVKAEGEKIKADLQAADEQAKAAADQEIMTPDAKKIVDDESAQVQQKVSEQLKATGRFSDKDIKHLSSLWSNFARVFGGRNQQMPAEYFAKNPLSVKTSDSITPKEGQTEMNQGAADYKIGDQIEFQEPGGKFYAGRIKSIKGNMATIYNDSTKRSAKINLTLANKKTTMFQAGPVDGAVNFAKENNLVSPIDASSDVGFINGDNFIQLGQYSTHDQLVSGMGMSNSREAVSKGFVRVHNQHGGGNYEVAAGNESGYDAINQALLAKGKDGFKGSIYVDILGQSGKSKSVDFKMAEFIEKGGDVRAFLPNEGSSLYFQPATPNKNLVAMHNIDEEGLAHADKMGGLAVPSLSIGKAGHPLEAFGDITLIGNKELIDPKVASNKVFNADIYSPRYPGVTYKISNSKLKELGKFLEKESNDLGRRFSSDVDANDFNNKGLEAVRNSASAQLKYLRTIGKDVTIPTNVREGKYLILNPRIENFIGQYSVPSDLYTNEDFLKEYEKLRQAVMDDVAKKEVDDGQTPEEATKTANMYGEGWYDEDGHPNYNIIKQVQREIESQKEEGQPNFYAAQSKIRNAIAEDKKGFDEWVDKNFKGLIEKESLYNGEDKNWNRKYLPHTLANVVRIMKRELQSGEGFNYGLGNLRASVAKRYRSIKAIQSDRSKILSKTEFEKVKEFTDKEFDDIVHEAYQVSTNKDMGIGDRLINAIQDGIKRGNMKQWLKVYDLEKMDVNRINAFLDVLRDMPTEYFEAKIQRAVGLNEFAGAIIPINTSQKTKDILNRNGIKFVEYDERKTGDRIRAINELGDQADIFFQLQENPLGAILFGKEGGFDMRLLKDMNYSTFLHETGHAFLEMLRRSAVNVDSPADIQDMSDKTLKWLGIEDWSQLERKHHEQFAKGFEKYLMEGKAPSEGLRQAFIRFRVWLVSVYKTLQGLDVELSSDIRNVMDRMLATDQEIALAQSEQGQVSMIQDPISILGEEKGNRYLKAKEETEQESEATLQLKLMEEYQRERKSWWMDELKNMLAQVAKEVNARAEHIAISILQRGKMPDGTDAPQDMKDLKIDAKDLVRFFSNKFSIEVNDQDQNALAAEFNVDQLEGVLRDIEQFRSDVKKIRKYDDAYLSEELSRMPKRYVTSNKYAKTLDEAATDLGYESDMSLLDRMIENEEAYKSVAEELTQARKTLRSFKKANRDIIYSKIKEAMRELPRRITGKEGISVDVVGQLFGYSSADQFLDVLSRTPKRNDLIRQIAIGRMNEAHGELYGDKEAMHEQALQAIHNDKKEQLLRMELEYLASNHTPVLKDLIRTVASRIPTSAFVKKYAADIIGNNTLDQISPYQYQLAERRSAKAAGQALTQGKFDEAFEHKRKELLNYELYRAATAARNDIQKSLTDFKKISRSDSALAKSRDLDYINAARSILAMYGIGEGSEDPYQFIKQTQAYDPDTFATITALIDAATENVANYQTITYDQFVNMKEAVNAIWEISRRSRQIQIADQKMEIDEVRKHLIDRIMEMTKKDKSGYTKSATENDKFSRAIMGAIAQGRRVESWVDVMDGGDSKGWFTQAIWNPVIQGTQEFRIKNKEYIEKFLELVKPIENSLTGKEIVSDELKHIFHSKAELLGALLHTGNESNLSKLLRGRGWGMYSVDGVLDTSRWDTFIKRMQEDGTLTKGDYDFIQSVWDLFEDLKTASQKAHKEMYGHYFKTITTDEVNTPWGKYRGGYAPAIVDPFVSEDAAIRQEKEAADNVNNSYMFPTTGRGFTKGRVERYAAPLAMDLRLIPQHINKVLRFSYIEPRVKDVGRIIRNPEFREVLRDLDPSVGQYMLSPWLQRSAQQVIETPNKSLAGWRVWRELRTRSGINIMAGNVVNTLQQFTGLSIAAVKVKPSYLRNSLWRFMQNPNQVSREVHEQSDFMKTRTTTHIIEIQKTIDDLILNQNKYEKAIDFAKQHGYFLQQGTQNMVDMVTWPAAYDQSVAGGNTHEQAVRDADAAVRLTQGDFSPENVSNIESGNSLARMFLMFYSYFNMQANLLGTEFAKIPRDLGLKRGAGRAFYIYMFGFMIPAVVSQLILKALSGEDWDKDDDGYLDDALAIFFGSQFTTATAMFPFVGQVANSAVNRFNNKWYDDDIRTSPAISMIESAIGSPKSVYKAIVDDGNKKTAIRDVLSLLGILTGAPVAPLSKPLGYLSDVSDGKVYPENNLDFTRGLITGKSGK